jgi:anti-anti-sigma regulatory factor
MAQAITLLSGHGYNIVGTPHQGSLILKFQGQITEDTQLGQLMTVLTPHLSGLKGLLLDVSAIERINSCGIREWLLFLEKLGTMIPFAFLSVSELFIEQAAVIPQLLGKAGTHVLSFQAPFFCPSCNTRSVRSLSPKQILTEDAEYRTPTMLCEKCKSQLEFDGMEEEYFRFLNYSRAPRS